MKVLYGIAVALLVLAAAAVAYAVSPRAIEAVKRPDPQSFDGATVAHGERLALIGNCAECHTAEQGEAYAGGRAIPTPFGTIYATNITPDPETGIGTWSREAFRRSMYEGLDREGEHLYPAFPYHHFTKVLPEDIDALYAYLMTREPVRNEAPANELRFPFNLRPLLAGWKLLYLDNGRFAGLADADEKVNRGAYLVQGLAHCGGCHTPRNALQAEKKDEFLQGEVTENWYAPAISGDVPAAVKWSENQLADYLTGRWVEQHGVALGAMAPVAHNLSRVTDEDVVAISAYIASLMEDDTAETDAEITGAVGERPDSGDVGAVIYAGACAVCHDASPSPFAAGLPLAFSTSLRIPTPLNLIQIIENGVKPPEGQPGRYMPGFAGALTDEQLVALASYLRGRFTGRDPWADIDSVVKATATEGSAGAEISNAE
ncbi:nicotinate dehydrogenase subunit B [Sinorhizobium kostiense]|uniref:Nicotinate dehydrogenase subunit B n=1 Tax=Sinorhizobium kostiense TaxID=76747 RepID=A0ABS4QUU4_9HYPH|nr:cytochrome c [Sinorhizobium kostiense]MBP2234417.1 nicotinate dehydrogenase subunit B [Sinorhizobium kostiense]